MRDPIGHAIQLMAVSLIVSLEEHDALTDEACIASRQAMNFVVEASPF